MSESRTRTARSFVAEVSAVSRAALGILGGVAAARTVRAPRTGNAGGTSNAGATPFRGTATGASGVATLTRVP